VGALAANSMAADYDAALLLFELILVMKK